MGSQGRLSRPGSANICGHIGKTSPSCWLQHHCPTAALPAPALLSRFDLGLSGRFEEPGVLGPPNWQLPAPGMTAAVAFLLLSLLRMAAAKGVWCPACGLAALAPATQRDILIALAKQSILSKLRLPDRPNITQPTSRGALLTALRRMWVQRTDAPVAPGVLRASSVPHPPPVPGVQHYEILSFAESGVCRTPRPCWRGGTGPHGWGAWWDVGKVLRGFLLGTGTLRALHRGTERLHEWAGTGTLHGQNLCTYVPSLPQAATPHHGEGKHRRDPGAPLSDLWGHGDGWEQGQAAGSR